MLAKASGRWAIRRGRKASALYLSLAVSLMDTLAPKQVAAQSSFHQTNGWDAAELGVDDSFGIAVGDVDGDGDQDIVATNSPNSGPQKVIVLQWNGSTWSRTELGVGFYPRQVAIGDIDHDGDVDIVTVNDRYNGVPGNLTFWTREGNGWTRRDQALNVDPRGVAIGDADGDGINEVVFGNYQSQTVTIQESGSPQQDVVVGGSPLYVTMGDVDSDGGLDIVVGNYNGVVTFLRWDGSRWKREDVEQESSASYLAIGDADNDGDNDVLVAPQSFSSSDITLLRREGSGWSQQPISSTGSAIAVAIGDVDGDGDNDLAVLSDGGQTYALRWHRGNWTTESVPGGSRFESGRGICVADVNKDGHNDIVTSNRALLWTGRSWDRENVPIGTEIGYVYYSATPGDVDHDGNTDLVIADDLGETVTVLGRDPSGWTQRQLNVGRDPGRPVLGDIDKDGDADIVTRSGRYLTALRWNGAGWTRKDADVLSDQGALTIGDANNDGHPDIVLSEFDRDQVTVLRWTGADWTKQSREVNSYPEQVVVGDVDGDGDRDIVVRSGYDPAGFTALLWGGNGWVRKDKALGSVDEGVGNLILGDADNDGDLEIVASVGESVSVLRWTGDGWSREDLPIGESVETIVVADADGDSDNDLLVGMGAGGVAFHRWTRNAWTRIDLVTGEDPESFLVRELVLGDADNDGVLDIVTINEPLESGAPESISIFRKNGGGWSQNLLSTLANSPNSVAIVDLDHDGKNEIALVGAASSSVSLWRWVPSHSVPHNLAAPGWIWLVVAVLAIAGLGSKLLLRPAKASDASAQRAAGADTIRCCSQA